LRFLLANLYDYEPKDGDDVAIDIDRWALEKAAQVELDCCKDYDDYDFNAALTRIHNFCAKELSQFYLDAIKDRMYCDAKDSDERRSGQIACHRILLTLTKLIAPLLPHTAEEVYARTPMKNRLQSVMMEVIEPRDAVAVAHGFDWLLEFRERVFAELEGWKSVEAVKDSQDVLVRVAADAETKDKLDGFGEELPNLLRVSWVETNESEATKFSFEKSPYLRCERSRLRRPDVEEVNGIPLTKRDRRVIGW
jgi:isoleucyl-tRNA synthetase